MDEDLREKLRNTAVTNVFSTIRYLEQQLETVIRELDQDMPGLNAKGADYEALKTALETYKKALEERARNLF